MTEQSEEGNRTVLSVTLLVSSVAGFLLSMVLLFATLLGGLAVVGVGALGTRIPLRRREMALAVGAGLLIGGLAYVFLGLWQSTESPSP